MSEQIAKGSWVEIHNVVLTPDERAPQVPEDTQSVPLEMRVKGFLVAAAAIGEKAEIVTPVGRRLHGTLITANPVYDHGFGSPIPELSNIGSELKAMLHARGRLE